MRWVRRTVVMFGGKPTIQSCERAISLRRRADNAVEPSLVETLAASTSYHS